MSYKNNVLKNISLKLFPFLISLLFLFPILKESLSSFLVILLCLNTIIYKIASKDYKLPEAKIYLLTLPFWIILISSFFSSDFQKSMVHIQHALFFLIIPIFFSLIPKEFFTWKRLNSYLSILKITCLLIAVVYIVSFFIYKPANEFFVVYNNVSGFRNYIYGDFKLFVIHSTYYTSILILCIAHSFSLVLNQKKYFEIIYVLTFLFISFVLLTRLNMVLLMFLLIGMFLFMSKINLKTKTLISLLFVMIVSSIAYFTPGIKQRFVEMYNSFNSPPVDVNYDSTNIRKAIFDCSVSISKENFMWGVGFENLQLKLNDCYGKNYDSSFYETINYMTHNYFFYILTSVGIIGLIFFLLYVANILNIAFRSKLFLFNIFVINAFIVCLVEDYFYRHYGILYFNLVLMCFIQYSKNQYSKEV